MSDLAPPGWTQGSWLVYTEARLNAILLTSVGLLAAGIGFAAGTSAIKVSEIEDGNAVGFTVDAILPEVLLAGMLINVLGFILIAIGLGIWGYSRTVRARRAGPEGDS